MFVPGDLEQKIVATAVYGTTLVAVDSVYDDVNRLCMELAADRPWAFVNGQRRPYYSEARRRSPEVAEQLGWSLPDRCTSSRSPPARSTPRSTAASAS